MKKLTFTLVGNNEIRLNNPQTSDPLNVYAKKMAELNAIRKKDEPTIIQQRLVDVESKLYWDNELHVYVPSSWIMEAIAKESFAQVKLAKAKMRSSVFISGTKIKLNYDGMETVNEKKDITHNERFKVSQIIKQGMTRIVKTFPQFTGWSMDIEIIFNEDIIAERSLRSILDVAAKYNGFGDFRPTFGTATIHDWVCEDEVLAA